MGIKIHDPAFDDLAVSVPTDWPPINVSQFQKNKSLGKEVDPDTLKDLLSITASEIAAMYNTDVLMLPLDQLSESYFRLAVFELTLAKLLPSLPVNNSHDAKLSDPEAMTRQIRLLKRNAAAFMKEIPGYNPKPTISSRVIDETTETD